MKSYSSREVIQALKADGWFEVNTVGSHHQFKHPTVMTHLITPIFSPPQPMKLHLSPGENGWYDSHVSNQHTHPFSRTETL